MSTRTDQRPSSREDRRRRVALIVIVAMVLSIGAPVLFLALG